MRGPRVTAARVFGVVVLGLLVLILWDSQRSWREAKRSDDAERAQAAPPAERGLAGRASDVGSPAVVAPPPAPSIKAVPKERVVTHVRLLLTVPGEPLVPLAVARVMHKGNEWPGATAAVGGPGVKVTPGSILNVWTEDPRAAFDLVGVRLGDPVPDPVTVEIPAATDPRLRNIVVEVIDGKTREPIPGAKLDRVHEDGPVTRISDARGRIPVNFREEDGGGNAISRLLARGFAVSARGHHSNGESPLPRPSPWRWVPGPELASFLEHGTWRVVLDPTDAPERAVRLVGEHGHPVADTLIFVARALPTGTVQALINAAGDSKSLFTGYVRTDAEGVARFPASDGPVQILVFHRGSPFLSFGLARVGVSGAPRELLLPAVAEAEITLLDDEGRQASWERDPVGVVYGNSRPSIEGYPPPEVLDPDVALAFAEGSLATVFRGLELQSLRADDRTLRLPVPVGRTTLLYTSDTGGLRTLALSPTAPGPFRVSVRWEDLARWTPPPGRDPLADPDDPMSKPK